MSTIELDIRCPGGTNSLLLKTLHDDTKSVKLSEDKALLQLHCKECTKDFRRILPDDVLRVLHVFTTTAEFKYTQVQFRDGEEQVLTKQAQEKVLKLAASFKHGVPL